jgi:hypothetical protein
MSGIFEDTGPLGITCRVLADPILATVNHERLSSDKCGVVTCQEQNCAGHVIGLSQPLDGLLLQVARFCSSG